MRKYLIFNLIEFFLWGYTSYWDMTFNYKTNLSIQDSIFHSCTFIPLLWFIEVKNIKNTSFKNPQESATSLFYLLTHKYLLQNNLQILELNADERLFFFLLKKICLYFFCHRVFGISIFRLEEVFKFRNCI